MAQYSLLVLKV